MSDITEKHSYKKNYKTRDSIVDSLNYAKYIQRSLLCQKMENYFEKFNLFHAKRYRWWRFYWFKTFGEKQFDC